MEVTICQALLISFPIWGGKTPSASKASEGYDRELFNLLAVLLLVAAWSSTIVLTCGKQQPVQSWGEEQPSSNHEAGDMRSGKVGNGGG